MGNGYCSLSREEGERILLKLPSGEIITVMLSTCRNHQARIAIKAPVSVVIAREELADQIFGDQWQEAVKCEKPS